VGYPLPQLREEVAYIAYYLHWSYAEVMALDHRERRHWVGEVAKINRRLNDDES
jgi:hypothetical protein